MNPSTQKSLSDDVKNYTIVTLAYWADTLVDGAIRMLVLFYFYQLGYSAFEIASLFVFYELFGVFTNLFGGFLASKYGLKLTLKMGLSCQLVALMILAILPAAWLTIATVMISQALSGIAKDLTKMSSKSSVKLIAGDGMLYRWVSWLTGSKNAMKGVGFFLGSLLLSWIGFVPSIWALAALIAIALFFSSLFLKGNLNQPNFHLKFRHIRSNNKAVNRLSFARMFLFGARDMWFVIALPVFLSSVLKWPYWQSGGFMAFWIMGYGVIQAFTPNILRAQPQPTGSTATKLALVLSLIPLLIAVGLYADIQPTIVTVAGLILFGIAFALNSSVHSYLILAFTHHDKVALNVGIYYMANAAGRLFGTLISGYLYPLGARLDPSGGLITCLVVSSLFLIITSIISRSLPKQIPNHVS